MSAPVVTVLYEDKMAVGARGAFPFHDLVMRMVEDEIDGETWVLAARVSKNPRNGIGKLIKELDNTSLIAGTGKLFVLVDLDRVREHLKLRRETNEGAVIDALRQESDAPEKVECFFLYPNLEGLLQAIRACDPVLLANNVSKALRKSQIDRDLVFRETKKAAHRDLRYCVRRRQPGLDNMVCALSAELSATGTDEALNAE